LYPRIVALEQERQYYLFYGTAFKGLQKFYVRFLLFGGISRDVWGSLLRNILLTVLGQEKMGFILIQNLFLHGNFILTLKIQFFFLTEIFKCSKSKNRSNLETYFIN